MVVYLANLTRTQLALNEKLQTLTVQTNNCHICVPIPGYLPSLTDSDLPPHRTMTIIYYSNMCINFLIKICNTRSPFINVNTVESDNFRSRHIMPRFVVLTLHANKYIGINLSVWLYNLVFATTSGNYYILQDCYGPKNLPWLDLRSFGQGKQNKKNCINGMQCSKH